ncbi:Exocyst complex component SEC15B [Trichinella spiralis]|uniref:Exocyst complex component SEC15B n=1 Tax=Trichinella spiralis TaxID=6334 RepID=A0ABR3K919_TRISP
MGCKKFFTQIWHFIIIGFASAAARREERWRREGPRSTSQSRVDYAECILRLPSSVENFENHVLTKSPFVWHLEDKIPQLISPRPHLVMFDSVECVL